MRQEPGWYESLSIRHGQPQLYNTFMSNVVRAGLQGVITPFPCTSETACAILHDLGFYFEICYVDASHDFAAVKRDLELCWPLLKEPGVLIGDDYGWPTVKSATDAFAQEHGLTVGVDIEKYFICKGRQPFPA